MDTTTFHFFPRLPFELREQIWQDACLQLGPSERLRNIHYMYMDENRNIWPRDYDSKTDDLGNRSGYTWHSYIWHDICFITTDSWESLLRPWRPIYVQTEDTRGRRRLKKPRNIGVKFDPSWEEELENAVQNTGFATVLRDLSPRLAFMIRLLFEVAPNDFPAQSKVMLIDDVSEWQSFDTEGHGGCRVFDSGQEYVELGYVLGFIDMSPDTFHPFPNLPVEIRLQIWEDACFDWGCGRFGLHYIQLNENRSAFLWHAGLWTACKESRDIVGKHWSSQGWNWKPLHIEAEDEWGRRFIDDVVNVAVEFDPSWYQEVKRFKKDNRISDYPPSLSFLIRLLLDQAHNKKHRKSVLLIDRNVLWHVENEALARYHPIYRDCDHEYFEINSHELKRDSPLSDFLSLLDRSIGDKLTKIEYGEPSLKYNLSESDWEQDDRLPPEELMRYVPKRGFTNRFAQEPVLVYAPAQSMETLEFGLEIDVKGGEKKRTSAVPGILGSVSLQTMTQEALRDVSPLRTETGKDIELASVAGRVQHHDKHSDHQSCFSHLQAIGTLRCLEAENNSNQQPSRGGFGRARGQRNFSNLSNTSRRPSGQQQQQQQQQQQVAALAAKPKPTPGSREVGSSQPEMTRVLMILTHVFSLQEAEAHMAHWEAREQSSNTSRRHSRQQ
ncbi:hypothetical protein FANTH_364 [Fusarium anthophilum]|uniref:2EXR domain-containing protein n=1 Tax=Fusarium anthophilum TaxID=48485 RepID=A0A8H5EC73_9HYPO|nr:hypothetical protein FANTH_364 [Fusarium anthophilum]